MCFEESGNRKWNGKEEAASPNQANSSILQIVISMTEMRNEMLYMDALSGYITAIVISLGLASTLYSSGISIMMREVTEDSVNCLLLSLINRKFRFAIPIK